MLITNRKIAFVCIVYVLLSSVIYSDSNVKKIFYGGATGPIQQISEKQYDGDNTESVLLEVVLEYDMYGKTLFYYIDDGYSIEKDQYFYEDGELIKIVSLYDNCVIYEKKDMYTTEGRYIGYSQYRWPFNEVHYYYVNAQGLLSMMEGFKINTNALFEKEEYMYDENDRLIKKIRYNKKNEFAWEEIFYYQDNLLVKSIIHDISGETSVVLYNNNGDAIEVVTRDKNNIEVGLVLCEYDGSRLLRYFLKDKQGILDEIIKYNDNGDKIYHLEYGMETFYFYNDFNKLIGYSCWSDGKIRFRTEYLDFDKYGNYLKKITYSKDNTIESIRLREVKYFDE